MHPAVSSVVDSEMTLNALPSECGEDSNMNPQGTLGVVGTDL